MRTGPEPRGDPELPQNQCPFLRGFRLTVNAGFAALRGRAKVSTLVSEKPGDILPGGKGSYIPFMDGGNRSWSGKDSGKGSSRGGLERTSPSVNIDAEQELSSDEDVLLEGVPGIAEVISSQTNHRRYADAYIIAISPIKHYQRKIASHGMSVFNLS